MKLKLEAIEDITILSVNDFIGAQHLPVLKAGLTKLFQSGKRTILMDLSALGAEGFQPLELTQDIAALRSWSFEQGAHLIIASPVQDLGDAATRDLALQGLTSPLGKLLALEARLQAQLRMLEARKEEVEKRVTSMEQGGGDVRALRRENGELKARIADLERQIRSRLETRTNPAEAQSAQFEAASRILVSVLEQEGVLPVI